MRLLCVIGEPHPFTNAQRVDEVCALLFSRTLLDPKLLDRFRREPVVVEEDRQCHLAKLEVLPDQDRLNLDLPSFITTASCSSPLSSIRRSFFPDLSS